MQIQDNLGSIIFIIFYLVTIWTGLFMLWWKRSQSKKASLPAYWYWVFLSYFLLGFGDLFHLGFRVYIFTRGYGPDDPLTNMLFAIGYIVTGITMTYFYISLLHAWNDIYGEAHATRSQVKTYFLVVYAFFVVRLILMALPWNSWYDGTPLIVFGVSFRVFTSLPLYVIGFYPIVLLYKSSKKDLLNKNLLATGVMNKANYFASIWFMVSYACYTLTILFTIYQPLFGLFMIPKTIAYLVAFYYHYKALVVELKGEETYHEGSAGRAHVVVSS